MVSGNLPSTLEKAGGPLGVSWTRVALLQPDLGSGSGTVEKPRFCHSLGPVRVLSMAQRG